MGSVALSIIVFVALLQDQGLPPLPDGAPPADFKAQALQITRTDYDRQFPRLMTQGRVEEALQLAEQYLDTHPSEDRKSVV